MGGSSEKRRARENYIGLAGGGLKKAAAIISQTYAGPRWRFSFRYE
jgi:hypothetical protein